MRLGLVLEDDADLARARRADELGLWAVTVTGPPGTEVIRAARVAERTEFVRVVVSVDLGAEHPLTIAEELAVLDNLSGGRAVAIVTGDPGPETLLRFREALVGRLAHGVVLAPPPVQTELPVWLVAPGAASDPPIVADSPTELVVRPGLPAPGTITLSGSLARDRRVIDEWRDAGCTHLLVSWPGDVRVLARHLATRAATSDFPSVVADLADELAPFEPDPD